MSDRKDQERLTGPSTRRSFLWGVTAAGAMVGAAVAAAKGGRRKLPVVRPPGALPDGEFESACSRCFACGSACPNKCIEYQGLEGGLAGALTPVIKPRSRGCTLCGKCAEVCPTGALKPFEPTEEGWKADVDMGTAHVNEGLCYSFAGRTCGACYRACPLAGEAIKIGLYEQPHVNPDVCVGCGLCEQACLHLPQAIRVIPRAARPEVT